MDAGSQYVPLAWYNSGYSKHMNEPLRRTSHHMVLPPTSLEPLSQYDQSHIHPALRTQARPNVQKPIIYATIRPSLPRLRTGEAESTQPTTPTTPTSPVSSRSSISSRDGSSPSSSISDTSSVRSDASLSSSPLASPAFSRTLRRATRRPRAMSLRELRRKQSEANLLKACTFSVDEYLNGDLFHSFRAWPEESISEH